MNVKRLTVGVLALLFILGAVGCSPSQKSNEVSKPSLSQTTENNQKTADYLVDSAWLMKNLQGVTILDARAKNAYDTGHIPGAINATWQSFAAMDGKSGDKGWGTLLPKDKLAEKFGAVGISPEKTVVIYTDPNGWGEDGRLLWMFKMAGLKNTKLLSGGWTAWKTAKGEVSTQAPAVTPTKVAITSLDEGMNATTEWIQANAGKIKLIDARAKKEYDGATDFGENRGGHLPNAINISFKEAMNDDGTIKSIQDLKDLFTKAGLKPDDEIVTYCTKGIRSAHLALMLRLAGFEKARNYDASFYEWAGNPDLPLAK